MLIKTELQIVTWLVLIAEQSSNDVLSPLSLYVSNNLQPLNYHSATTLVPHQETRVSIQKGS